MGQDWGGRGGIRFGPLMASAINLAVGPITTLAVWGLRSAEGGLPARVGLLGLAGHSASAAHNRGKAGLGRIGGVAGMLARKLRIPLSEPES